MSRCEVETTCRENGHFLVELLSAGGRVSRPACGVHLPAAVNWVHEIAGLRVAMDEYAPPTMVTVTPIPDPIDLDTFDVDEYANDDSHDLRPIIEREFVAAQPIGRDDPGLIAWTQRAFHQPGYYPPTRGHAIAGLILCPLLVAGLVALVVSLRVPITPAAIRHAVDSNRYRFSYPDAGTELVRRSAATAVLLCILVMVYLSVQSYWRTRPTRYGGDVSDPTAPTYGGVQSERK